jgi:hypothetical protein
LSVFKFLIISLLLPIFAFANYGDSFGIGTRNNFLGGSADVTDGGAFASVGNPAVLVNAYNAPFDLSFRTNQPSLESPNLKFKNQPLTGLPNDTYKSENAGNMSTFSGGGNLPLGKRLVLGGSILLPLDSLARVYAFSGNESNYLHYMDRQSRPEIYTGLGLRAFDWVSLGAGFFGSVKANGTLQTGITQENAEARVLLELKPVLIPYGGLLFEKTVGEGKLLFGTSFRAEHSAKTNLTVDMRFTVGPGTLPFSADSQLIAFYDPAKLSLGFGYQTANYGLYLSGENLFWSGYKSNIVKLGGPDLSVLTTGQSSTSPIKLQDSWSFKTGYEIKNWGELFNAKITNQFGFEYYQSALPKNPSSLSILDSERFVFDAGFSFGMPGIGEFISKPLNINFGGKYSHLVARSFSITDKTGNIMTAQVAGNVLSLIAGLSFEI